MRTLLTRAHVVSPDCEIHDGAILIGDRKISAVLKSGEPLPAAERVIDLCGRMVMPGFIDVHCHGRNGDDFSDGDAAGVARISQKKLQEGVTSCLPTSLTLPQDRLLAMAQAVKTCVDQKMNGCKLPGLHLEGPFVNPEWLGAQNPAFVRLPEMAEVLQIHAIYPVRKVTLAPEMPGGVELTEKLRNAGIVPSGGHSGASHAEFTAAYAHGLRNLTHFGNQMSKLHHREIGLIGAGMLHQDVWVELIADKLHLCAEMVKLLFQVKGAPHIELITDALRCTGMPDGAYTFGGVPFTLKNGEARLANGALAGSALTMNQALKNVWEITRLPLTKLVSCTSWNQAQSLGLTGLGKIEPGFAADLAVLDDDFAVRSTWVDGEARFTGPDSPPQTDHQVPPPWCQ